MSTNSKSAALAICSSQDPPKVVLKSKSDEPATELFSSQDLKAHANAIPYYPMLMCVQKCYSGLTLLTLFGPLIVFCFSLSNFISDCLLMAA